MRILLVHNFYGSDAPSGENAVFWAEKHLLQKLGHTVKTFTRNSDEIRGAPLLGAIRGGAAVPWNPFAVMELKKIVESFEPDLVHAHNTFPLISPGIFHAIGTRAARVLTLHNYRLLCSAGIPMRGGQTCTQCIDQRSVLPALKYRCYRGSRLATVPLAVNVALHRAMGTWQRQVDAFIVLSDFQKHLMGIGGLPLEKCYVKPNFYSGQPQQILWAERGNYVVFVGRLSPEKGLRALIKAWVDWGVDAPELRLVGDGPLREVLQRQASGANVRFLGQVNSVEAESQIARAQLLVLPSECFEGFPMVVREAFAFGTPAAVSNIGPLPNIVKSGVSGLLFEPGNFVSIRERISEAWKTSGLLERLSKGARDAFDTLYNEKANYEMLMNIYQEAIITNRSIRS